MEAEGVSESETVRANGVRSRTVRVKGRVCGDMVCQRAGGVILDECWWLRDKVTILLPRLGLNEPGKSKITRRRTLIVQRCKRSTVDLICRFSASRAEEL